ncbi:TPA: gp436 family protein [Vibrio parahaemolyticus]
MAIYATKQDLLDRDSQMLWNFAVDRDTNTLNDTWINQALDQADEKIDSFLGRRYVLPLPTVPGILNKIAIIIAFYWLADRDQQATNLLEERYKMQLETLREISNGKRELGLPTIEAPQESSVGKVELVQDNERQFTRKSLKGVL